MGRSVIVLVVILLATAALPIGYVVNDIAADAAGGGPEPLAAHGASDPDPAELRGPADTEPASAPEPDGGAAEPSDEPARSEGNAASNAAAQHLDVVLQCTIVFDHAYLGHTYVSMTNECGAERPSGPYAWVHVAAVGTANLSTSPLLTVDAAGNRFDARVPDDWSLSRHFPLGSGDVVVVGAARPAEHASPLGTAELGAASGEVDLVMTFTTDEPWRLTGDESESAFGFATWASVEGYSLDLPPDDGDPDYSATIADGGDLVAPPREWRALRLEAQGTDAHFFGGDLVLLHANETVARIALGSDLKGAGEIPWQPEWSVDNLRLVVTGTFVGDVHVDIHATFTL